MKRFALRCGLAVAYPTVIVWGYYDSLNGVATAEDWIMIPAVGIVLAVSIFLYAPRAKYIEVLSLAWWLGLVLISFLAMLGHILDSGISPEPWARELRNFALLIPVIHILSKAIYRKPRKIKWFEGPKSITLTFKS